MKQHLVILELELQVVVIFMAQVLGTELRVCARAVSS